MMHDRNCATEDSTLPMEDSTLPMEDYYRDDEGPAEGEEARPTAAQSPSPKSLPRCIGTSAST